MTQIGQRFGLSHNRGDGIFCSEDGLFVGDVPLLKQSGRASDLWQLRPISDLNRDLSRRYGLPIELDGKIGGLTAVARALNRGDLVHAQIAALHLRIPDPPSLAKSRRTTSEIMDLAYRLRASGLLKADWDPAKHPRWPAGSPDSIGGQFAPTGSPSTDSNAPVIPVQAPVISTPFEFALPRWLPVPRTIPLPRTSPLPSEIAPAFPSLPDIHPRDVPRNPYPDDADCAAEWAEAEGYCTALIKKKLMGKDGYRGQGKFFYQCVMGRVSERCGGNSTGA